ncbi:MAG: hypothetical protein AAFO58_12875, partial [Pseudomonadota bacterium]
MAQQPEKQTNLGIYDRPGARGISAAEVIAVALSAIWLIGAAVFFLGLGGAAAETPSDRDQLRFVMTLMAVFLPVAIIWTAAAAARSARIMREESRRLQAAIDAMRQTYVADRQASVLTTQPNVAAKLDEIAEAAKQTETAVATFASSRDKTPDRAPARPAPAGEIDMEQPALELGT